MRDGLVQLEGVPTDGECGRGRIGDGFLEEGNGTTETSSGEVAEGTDGIRDDLDVVVCHGRGGRGGRGSRD